MNGGFEAFINSTSNATANNRFVHIIDWLLIIYSSIMRLCCGISIAFRIRYSDAYIYLYSLALVTFPLGIICILYFVHFYYLRGHLLRVCLILFYV